MSPVQPAVVTESEVSAARESLRYRTPLVDIHPDFVRAALKAAAAVRSDDVTTRLTEAADRVAKAEERAERAEALLSEKQLPRSRAFSRGDAGVTGGVNNQDQQTCQQGIIAPEDEAEHFIQAAVDRAPEPLKRLGLYLTDVLDEDEFKTAERMLLGAIVPTHTENQVAEWGGASWWKDICEDAAAQISDLTARAEKAEAAVFELQEMVSKEEERAQEISIKLSATRAQVTDLTRKLDEARGVLRAVEWCDACDEPLCCPVCHWYHKGGHKPGCRLAAVLAPETGKSEGGGNA